MLPVTVKEPFNPSEGLTMMSRICLTLALFSLLWVPAQAVGQAGFGQYEENPFVFALDIPGPADSAGGLVAADLNNDGLMDYLVTVPGHIAAYGHNGSKLWILNIDVRVGGSSEREGLPGHCGPGVQAADIDGDARTDVLFLTQDSVVHVVDGASGEGKWAAKPPFPDLAERWEHLVVVNLRGEDDRDLLLQATNKEGYRVGHMIAAYALSDLAAERYEPLWQRNDLLTCAHNGVRAADLTGDGRDEVIAGQILNPADGEWLCNMPVKGHLDALFVADVRPDLPGLEVVALEEGGGNRIFLASHTGMLWETHHRNQEPQNTAVGVFSLDHEGLQIWCRSRYNEHQKPFVFNAAGELIAEYEMDNVAPKGWTASGVELIWTIDWTGGPKQFAAAKERHTSGDVAIFDPLKGTFVTTFEEKADRLYVADVSGDWREEIVVLAGNETHVYHTPAANPNPDRPRLWEQQQYRRSKMTYNYYSP